MAVSGADSAVLNRVLTTTLARYSKNISNELARNDGIIGVFGANGAIEVVNGGNRAIETVDYAENQNFGFRSAYGDIPTAKQDTRLQAKYAWATFSGSVAISLIEEAMNSGDAKLYPVVDAELKNAKNTIVRQIATGLRAASPAATDPESIQTIMPATASASQTTTTGELSRTTYNSFWRSQYTNTAMALQALAGWASLQDFYYSQCSKGPSKIDQPNFGLTTGTIFASLSAGFGDANRRFSPDDKNAKLGFSTIQVNNANILVDPSLTAGRMYLMNTEFLKLQVLRTEGIQDIGEKPLSFPISIAPFVKAYNSLHKVALMYVTFALTCSSLQRQGLADNLS